MISIFNSWWLNLIGYLICIVIFSQYYKLAVQNIKKDGAATVLIQFIAGASILLLVPFFPFKLPGDPKIYLLLILASVFYAWHDRIQTTVRKNIQVSLYVIIDRLYAVFLIIFGFTIFKDPFVLEKIIGAALILFGNFIVLYRKGKFELNKYVILLILATLMLSLAVSIDIGISTNFNLPFYIMLTLIVPAIMILFTEKITAKEIISQYSKNYLITGLSLGLLVFFLLRAYQFGQVTVVTSLAATSILINVLVAYIFLKERDHKAGKIIAACITILGIFLTVIK
ncbi:MAG: DMT family transporter [bacterium]